MNTAPILALLVGLAFPANAQVDNPTVRELEQSLQAKAKYLNPHYLLYSPETPKEEKFPLLIYLHGSGGRGNDVTRLKGQARALWHGFREFGNVACIMVVPQCLNKRQDGLNSTWTPEDLNLLLKHLKDTLPVDPTRIYLTGNSMGGYGTWVWGAHNPEHFAAIAPVSGGTGRSGPKDVTPDLEKWAEKLAKVPVHAFVGGKDRVVPPNRSEDLITAIQQAGGKVAKLRIYPDEGHNVRQAVYSSPEIYTWMLSKKRK